MEPEELFDVSGGAAVSGEAVAENDLLEIARSLCSIAARRMELTPVQRPHYPHVDEEGSPVLDAARAACVKRGYTEDGLSVEGVVYPRAADAPSEPSGLPPITASNYGTKTVCELELLRRTKRVGPDNLPRLIDNMKGSDPAIDSLIEYIVWQSRAADALDSQPTARPSVNQLAAQLCDGQTWTVTEQNAFAELLACFPNESSQGIISLGDAWKHGQAYGMTKAASQPAPASQESIGEDAQFWALLGDYVDTRLSPAYDDLIAYIDSRTSAAPAASVAPKGWQMVPIKPTALMLQNTDANPIWPGRRITAEHAWARMLAVAPAPQQEGSEAGNG